MDLNRIYNNPGLEARRLDFLKRLAAEEILRQSHEGSSSLVRQIELGFNTASNKQKQRTTRLTLSIADFARTLDVGSHKAFRMLLLTMEERGAATLQHRKHIAGMARLARFSTRWLRTLPGFTARSYNADRQFSELARYLLTDWPVPKFFDAAWSEQATDTQREWFIHLGSGANLRTAPGLPFPLTKMMAHQALLAPDNMPVIAALRWGQVRALRGSDRLARAVPNSLLGEAQQDEPFWLTVVQFFAANPMLDPHQVGPIVDWIRNQRFVAEPRRIINGVVSGGGIPQPKLSMKGRTVEGILRQVDRWHRDLNRAATHPAATWSTCGIPGYERVEGAEGSQRIVRIDEILTSADLHQEGRAMRHCVASYSNSCVRGHSAIYSLKQDTGTGYDRRLTIQVNVASRSVVQARARCNALPQSLDERYLKYWAVLAGLNIASY